MFVQELISLGCLFSLPSLGSLIWLDHLNNSCSKVPSTTCGQYFLLILLSLGISQELRECGHMISALELTLFIIVLMDYNEFGLGLVFKVQEKEFCIS